MFCGMIFFSFRITDDEAPGAVWTNPIAPLVMNDTTLDGGWDMNFLTILSSDSNANGIALALHNEGTQLGVGLTSATGLGYTDTGTFPNGFALHIGPKNGDGSWQVRFMNPDGFGADSASITVDGEVNVILSYSGIEAGDRLRVYIGPIGEEELLLEQSPSPFRALGWTDSEDNDSGPNTNPVIGLTSFSHIGTSFTWCRLLEMRSFTGRDVEELEDESDDGGLFGDLPTWGRAILLGLIAFGGVALLVGGYMTAAKRVGSGEKDGAVTAMGSINNQPPLEDPENARYTKSTVAMESDGPNLGMARVAKASAVESTDTVEAAIDALIAEFPVVQLNLYVQSMLDSGYALAALGLAMKLEAAARNEPGSVYAVTVDNLGRAMKAVHMNAGAIKAVTSVHQANVKAIRKSAGSRAVVSEQLVSSPDVVQVATKLRESVYNQPLRRRVRRRKGKSGGPPRKGRSASRSSAGSRGSRAAKKASGGARRGSSASGKGSRRGSGTGGPRRSSAVSQGSRGSGVGGSGIGTSELWDSKTVTHVVVNKQPIKQYLPDDFVLEQAMTSDQAPHLPSISYGLSTATDDGGSSRRSNGSGKRTGSGRSKGSKGSKRD